jgi:hypothetical protein
MRGYVLALSAAMAAVSVPAHAEDWTGDGGAPAFYSWNEALPRRPGVMLRTEPAPAEVSIPGAARAKRILHTSSDWRDAKTIITVSGIVFFPAGKPPRGGWPVIAWAHGTTGIADVCAPSLQPRSSRDREYLAGWLAKGYAIVATDYQGLGTPGVHPYLQFRAEGYSVLDSLRAALKQFPELSRRKLITMGQSQGGEGSIAAAYLAPRYAPELDIGGTVATGVVAHTQNIGAARQVKITGLYVDEDNPGNSAFEALWFLGTAGSIDPATITPEAYYTDNGLTMTRQATKACFRDLVGYAVKNDIRRASMYRRSSAELEAMVGQRTDFPDVRIETPVFVGTGAADIDARATKQFNFASAMCAAGTKVDMHYYAGADHSGAVQRSFADGLAFVQAVRGERKVAGNCAKLAPPAA